jgi:hypothetical protein
MPLKHWGPADDARDFGEAKGCGIDVLDSPEDLFPAPFNYLGSTRIREA